MSLPPSEQTIAIIGGTSLLESPLFHDARRFSVETPYGEVELLEKEQLLFLQRHGLKSYTPPHRIDHRANMAALKAHGATHIMAVGSVGSMRVDYPPGTVLVPDDFLGLQVTESFYDDARGHQVPGFAMAWRQRLLDCWPQSEMSIPVINGGVYWQTRGPRFETPAEIRMHQPYSDVVGMTVASECLLARELEMAYAAICIIDNYANGVSDEPLTYEAFKSKVAENEARLGSLLLALMERLTA
uniref:S-methyl-5'-thioadenosine phosphorylase n=1 Tax=Magnetococcus massalia (strain MO-1) TaxID=451514 RepID=A0A1S7LGY4_MAGMO|nr:S-methyl-5'-thioadenosine phosphorylase [Candidatus Magnetococcus massalia]